MSASKRRCIQRPMWDFVVRRPDPEPQELGEFRYKNLNKSCEGIGGRIKYLFTMHALYHVIFVTRDL